jgi:hypothetical protein
VSGTLVGRHRFALRRARADDVDELTRLERSVFVSYCFAFSFVIDCASQALAWIYLDD